ncbi:MAG: hypothetical protein WKF34_08235 [Pyrinomonadaceae bacterium]
MITFFVFYAVMLAFFATPAVAQSLPEPRPTVGATKVDVPPFRIEKTLVSGGAEIVTIFARPAADKNLTNGPDDDMPVISIMRDTLADDRPENDRLRYVWMLTHTRTSLAQKVSAMVPFLYTRTSNKGEVGTGPPPSILDIHSPNRVVWNKVFWILFKKLLLGEFAIPVRASTLQYRQNAADYRRTAVVGAMAMLSMYQEVEGEKLFTDSELKDMQARLSLTDKTFGWHMSSENLGRVYDRDLAKTRDFRGHNWELLRQYSEQQGLYFEPLPMPDGSVRHATVWTTAEDVAANRGKKFDGRFLNIKNPWTDKKLTDWKGYSEERWFDADDRRVDTDTPGATKRTMIPLALFGLDHPKIPVILVDFRDSGNAKKREISKRIFDDLTGGVLSVSKYGGIPFFLGRFIYDFITKRRGMDLNFESRLRSYAQLKLLLSLDASLDSGFRGLIAGRIESATVNPMQNDAEIEARLARTQYANLMRWARDPDGLPKKLENDRREEMTRISHNRAKRSLFGLASLVSFGLYKHRETGTPEMMAKMDIRRQLDFHERFLREVAYASAGPEVDTDTSKLKTSLAFVAENGSAAEEKTTRALAKIFTVTVSEELQTLCLAGLYRINNSAAKR